MSVPSSVRKQADTLVSSASAAAVTLHGAMEKEFPIVLQIQLSEWDFFLTIASVFVATTRLEQSTMPPPQIDELLQIVTERFSAWQPDAIRGFEDCKAFYDRSFDGLSRYPSYSGSDRAFLSADILGSWMVWNLFRHVPETEAERGLARVLGTYVTHEFSRWWDA